MWRACLTGFIILLMVNSSSGLSAAISPDIKYNGHEYKLFNDGMTWQQAKKYCEGLGGHLVTITSVQEQDIVVGLLRNKGTKNSYWMGGYKNGSYWVWITEEPFQYSKWATWQPDGDGSALMMYRNKNPYAREGLGYWNDVSFTGECKNEPFFGSVNFGFVCEWDSTPNTSIPINGEYGSGSKKTVTLPDGWYTIQPLHDLGRSIDALGSQVNSGNNVHMWDSVDSALQQKFYLQNRGNNYFSLRSAYGAKLYVTADGLGNGANLYTSSWNNSDSQLFRLVDAGKNSYHIFAKIGSNLNFDCAGGGKTNGNNVQLWTSENNNWHKWRFTKTSPPSNVTLSDGWYRIQPMHDLSRSVDALGNATHNGNNVHMWTNVDAAQQKFYLQNRGNGYFSLMSAYGSQLYITADGNSHGANLYTSDWTGSDAQLFKLSDAGDNSYNVFAKINENLNFDCYGGYTRDGNNVQLWNSENNKWHQWRFTKVFNNPQGEVQVVESTSPNTLHVRGTAFDLDNPSGSIRLHVYVGGTPGSSVPQYEIRTDGNSRIFDDTREIDSNYSGRQLVHIYALNDYGGGDYVQIWEGEVEIKSNVSDGLLYPMKGNIIVTDSSATLKNSGGIKCDYKAIQGEDTEIRAPADGFVEFRQTYSTKYNAMISYANHIIFTTTIGNDNYEIKCCHLSRFVGEPNDPRIIQKSLTRSPGRGCGESDLDPDGELYGSHKATITLGYKSIPVTKNQLLGYAGKTGNANGIHVHMEVRKNGKLVNPKSVFHTW